MMKNTIFTRTHKVLLLAALAVGLLAVVPVAQADDIIIDFEGGSGSCCGGWPYVEDGVSVTGNGHADILDNDADPDLELAGHSSFGGSGVHTFTWANPMTLVSVEIATYGGNSTFDSPTGAFLAASSAGTLVFPAAGWSDITSFTWNNGGTSSGPYDEAIDNVHLSTPARPHVPARDTTGDPNCGQDPHKWNAESGQYERKFSMDCYPYTLDQAELDYDDMWCGETGLCP